MPVAARAKPDWKLRVQLVIVGVVAACTILAILALAPVSHSYAEQFSGAGVATLTVPKNSDVSGSWATGDGSVAYFTIVDPNHTIVYSSDGPNGTYSFTASDPPYTLEASSDDSVTVYVWGTYSAPIL